jgi:hypothetical protein
MVTREGAKKVVRAGHLTIVVGGSIGLLVWLGAFFGDLSRPAIFFVWPIGLGGLIGLVGMILERSARST